MISSQLIGFCASTKVFNEALNAVQFFRWLKIFLPPQNILGPVKAQGIKLLKLIYKGRQKKTYFTSYGLLVVTQLRTPGISGLKSQILKPPYLS